MSKDIGGTGKGGVAAVILATCLTACGSGSDSGNLPAALEELVDTDRAFAPSADASILIPDITDVVPFDPASLTATYQVTVRNFWGMEDFPQGFPDNAHLSLFGGAVHNASVSFWEIGEPPSPGIEDMAEAGLIDILLSDEVAPAIERGTASSFIEVRQFTNPTADGEPGLLEFAVTVTRDHPLVSMTSMLGPSPDWFVGVSGLSLLDDSEAVVDQSTESTPSPWFTRLVVGSPLHDGGSKSDITPIMGGPDIIPPEPIGFVAYHDAAGVYLPTDVPQIVAEFDFQRIR